MNSLRSTPAKARYPAEAKTKAKCKTSQEEARFRRKAVRIWKTVAIKESQLNLLRKMKCQEVGTKQVEEFLCDLRSSKNSSKKDKIKGVELEMCDPILENKTNKDKKITKN